MYCTLGARSKISLVLLLFYKKSFCFDYFFKVKWLTCYLTNGMFILTMVSVIDAVVLVGEERHVGDARHGHLSVDPASGQEDFGKHLIAFNEFKAKTTADEERRTCNVLRPPLLNAKLWHSYVNALHFLHFFVNALYLAFLR
jgi:hypothetical protein